MRYNIVNKAEYKGYFKKKLHYLTDEEKTEYMRQNRDKCLLNSQSNYNENWFSSILSVNNINHKRQAIWGFRIYDFWIHSIGCAIEIDGPEHDEIYDKYRDIYNYLRSGIVVIRVRNKNHEDAMEAISFIKTIGPWRERRLKLKIEGKGVHPINLTNPKDKYWES